MQSDWVSSLVPYVHSIKQPIWKLDILPDIFFFLRMIPLLFDVVGFESFKTSQLHFQHLISVILRILVPPNLLARIRLAIDWVILECFGCQLHLVDS